MVYNKLKFQKNYKKTWGPIKGDKEYIYVIA